MKINMLEIPTVKPDQVVVIKVVGHFNEDRVLRRAESVRQKIMERDGIENILVVIQTALEMGVEVMDRMAYQKQLGEPQKIVKEILKDAGVPDEMIDIEVEEEDDPEED